jgi:periplasmic divalent cation tolerance protein
MGRDPRAEPRVKALVVLSTVSKAEDADRIAQALVERGLAACVNVVPGVLSTYRWKGAVQRDTERLLVIKTMEDRFIELRKTLIALHPYDMPEILALDVKAGHDAYLRWMAESVGGRTEA